MYKWDSKRPSNKQHIVNPADGKTHCRAENSKFFFANVESEEKDPSRGICAVCVQMKITRENPYKGKASRKERAAYNRQIKKEARLHMTRMVMNGDEPKPVEQKFNYKPPEKQKKTNKEKKDNFYFSKAWRTLRYQVLKEFGSDCMACKRPATRDRPPHVDHIKPRYLYPHLELVFDNLQVLCEDCNIGKGAWDETDWRPK